MIRAILALLLALPCSQAAVAQTSDPAKPNEPAKLEAIEVIAHRPALQPTPRERFRNQLRRSWHPPRSLEQFGMDGGVPAWLGQQMIRGMTKGARMLPGWKRPVQNAIARDSPLDDAQLDRAQQVESGGSSFAGDAKPR